jgi:hypothetical protein
MNMSPELKSYVRSGRCPRCDAWLLSDEYLRAVADRLEQAAARVAQNLYGWSGRGFAHWRHGPRAGWSLPIHSGTGQHRPGLRSLGRGRGGGAPYTTWRSDDLYRRVMGDR